MNLSSDLDFAAFIERVDGLNLSYQLGATQWARIRVTAYDAETDALRRRLITYDDARPRRTRRQPKTEEPMSQFTRRQIEIAIAAMTKRGETA